MLIQHNISIVLKEVNYCGKRVMVTSLITITLRSLKEVEERPYEHEVLKLIGQRAMKDLSSLCPPSSKFMEYSLKFNPSPVE